MLFLRMNDFLYSVPDNRRHTAFAGFRVSFGSVCEDTGDVQGVVFETNSSIKPFFKSCDFGVLMDFMLVFAVFKLEWMRLIRIPAEIMRITVGKEYPEARYGRASASFDRILSRMFNCQSEGHIRSRILSRGSTLGRNNSLRMRRLDRSVERSILPETSRR